MSHETDTLEAVQKLVKKISGFSSQPRGSRDETELLVNVKTYDRLRKESPWTALYQAGVTPQADLLDALQTNLRTGAKKTQASLSVAETLIREALKLTLAHAQRRARLDTAIAELRKLRNSHGDHCPAEVNLALARALYQRSLIVRPKGFDIPPRKKTLLQDAAKAVDEFLKINGDSVEANRIRAMIALEQEKYEMIDPEDLVLALSDAVRNGCTDFECRMEDVKIALRLGEKSEDRNSLCSHLVDIVNLKNDGSDYDMELERARAQAVLPEFYESGERIGMVESLAEVLRGTEFFDPLWEETVRFLKELRSGDPNRDKAADPLWERLAEPVIRACLEKEKRTDLSHTRWYWSRQRDLYDLAFLAQPEIAKKATIADATKNRISIRLSVMEKKRKDETETLKKAYLGDYINGLRVRIRPRPGNELPPISALDTSNVPKGWIVIHFYIVHLDGVPDNEKGYALIYDKDADKWTEKHFDHRQIFASYLKWQAHYLNLIGLAKDETEAGQASSRSFVDLCKAIGNSMSFLFDHKILKPESSVLFIPHDFLARLPLHAAWNETQGEIPEGLFLSGHPCAYLPAWEWTTHKDNKKGAASPPKGNWLFKCFQRGFYDNLEDDYAWDESYPEAERKDLLKVRKGSAPAFVAVLCHGVADYINPFDSALQFSDGKVTLSDVMDSNLNLQGTDVFLGACEPDLYHEVSGPVDEHLSVAAGFLMCGARAVVAPEYKTYPERIINLLDDIFANHSQELPATINVFQREITDESSFYERVVFKVYADITRNIEGD